MRTSASGSPNPGTGRPQYSQSRNAARFVRATRSRYRTRRGHRRHATTSEATRSKLSEDTGHPDSVRRQKRAPKETTKSIGCPPPPMEGTIVSKSRTVRFSRVVDLSQAVGPETQMFPAYPPPSFTQWTTREVHGFLAESMFLISHTGTHVDAPFHFEPKGRKLHELPIDRFIAPRHGLDLRVLRVLASGAAPQHAGNVGFAAPRRRARGVSDRAAGRCRREWCSGCMRQRPRLMLAAVVIAAIAALAGLAYAWYWVHRPG